MLTTDCIHSIDQLRAIAEEWNDLWQRSLATSAVHRAESVLSFLEAFVSGERRLCVITVRDDDRLLAALPIIQTHRLLGLSIGGLPNNEWSQPGTLLVDREADPEPIFACLLDGLQNCGFPLVRLDQIDLDLPDWGRLQAAFAERKIPHETTLQYDVGMVDVRGDFETLRSNRSKNLRSTLRRRRRRLEEQGEVRFSIFDDFTSATGGEPIEPLFQKMFELEQKSWKHDVGGAVLDNRVVFDFYVKLARAMDEGHYMRVALLEQNDRLVAYDLAVESKGVYHSYKVSYDPDFQRYGPGQLLHEEITRYACASPELDAIAYCGPMSDAIGAWTEEVCHVGRLSFSPVGFFNRLVWCCYRAAVTVRRLLK